MFKILFTMLLVSASFASSVSYAGDQCRTAARRFARMVSQFNGNGSQYDMKTTVTAKRMGDPDEVEDPSNSYTIKVEFFSQGAQMPFDQVIETSEDARSGACSVVKMTARSFAG